MTQMSPARVRPLTLGVLVSLAERLATSCRDGVGEARSAFLSWAASARGATAEVCFKPKLTAARPLLHASTSGGPSGTLSFMSFDVSECAGAGVRRNGRQGPSDPAIRSRDGRTSPAQARLVPHTVEPTPPHPRLVSRDGRTVPLHPRFVFRDGRTVPLHARFVFRDGCTVLLHRRFDFFDG